MALVVLVGVYFFASVVGEVFLLLVGLMQGWDMQRVADWLEESTAAQFANIFVVYGSMVLLTILYIRRYKVPLSRLGVVRPRPRDLGWALLAIPVYIAGYAILLAVMTQLFPSIDVEQEQQIGFDPGTSQFALLLTFVSLVILPPLVEEFIMRGFLFTTLLRRYKFGIAVVITSIIFALAHLQAGSGAPLLWVAAIDTFILSVILCYMRYKSGSLWPGITLHALKNGAAFMALFVFHLK